MSNNFLKVYKDLFKLGLNPTELMVLSQIIEFQVNTNNCFISNEALAEIFNVSEKTISRALTALEGRGFITRNTKNIKGGRDRRMTVNFDVIKNELTKVKLTLDDSQRSKCPLTTVKLSLVNGQNDLIKDNSINKKEKDNFVF